MAAPIDLYTWNTPNGRKISVALEEMGLPYAVHPVDITKGRQHDASFLRISPNNRIPAIVDHDGPGGEPLSVFESGAILIYLAEKTGRFLPVDRRARVQALEWLMWQMGGFGPMPGQVHHFLGVSDPQDQRYGLERYSKETHRLYGVMNKRLGTHEFFAGELSIADFAILGWAWRHERHQVDLNAYPNVKRWYDQMMARPAVQRGFAVGMN
ncbi:MAG: glutathione S-transferase N-terminal domain-containing protein [Betaproteobacteria bacterium]|nr:glutathione S-transferase N-terminal domain-containing protein [Betaproteobacteria bacterium]